MGIPSYFSNIIKAYPGIIQKLLNNNNNNKDKQVNNFYLDSNSIIYDAVRNVDFNDNNDINETAYSKIIRQVILKIEEYIQIVQPDNCIMIAFDGTAPIAKLDQQRERRYKSSYQAKISKDIFGKKTADPFNTTCITPGTKFMKELNAKVSLHFNNATSCSKYKVKKIIVTTSDEVGEGEHKIFDYIRNSPEVEYESINLVYGLDADLIMLSINHLPLNPYIYLFRETPEFIKSIDSSLEPNENYIMDIPELAKHITLDMNNGNEIDLVENRVYDYIFLCFFLGNDFMPHFPSVNIRTGGINKMINAYKATIGNTKDCLTDGKTIYWKNVRKVVTFLVNEEEKYLKDEVKLRDKRERMTNKNVDNESPEEIIKKFEALPTYERELEKFVNPYKPFWEARYYKALFQIDIDEERRKQICTNYLEGLEWTMKYYTTGCPDWRWSYHYNYPPLLCDLIKYIPYFDTTFIEENKNEPVTQLVQLCYVLPKESLKLLPPQIHSKLLKERGEWYDDDCEFVWAFCRYFWESHVKLPEIDICELENFLQICNM